MRPEHQAFPFRGIGRRGFAHEVAVRNDDAIGAGGRHAGQQAAGTIDDHCTAAEKSRGAQVHHRRRRLHPSEICAGAEAGKDSCEGDGGAPLVCKSKNNRWYVTGLVTWGVDCGLEGVPGVYANIYHFKNFIESTGRRPGGGGGRTRPGGSRPGGTRPPAPRGEIRGARK